MAWDREQRGNEVGGVMRAYGGDLLGRDKDEAALRDLCTQIEHSVK